MVNSGRTLEEAFAHRFVFGVGVSHRDSVDGRGASYVRLEQTMSASRLCLSMAPASRKPSKGWRLSCSNRPTAPKLPNRPGGLVLGH